MALALNLAGPRGRRIQDLLHGVWLGHPLNPPIAGAPIGAWTAALVLDTADTVESGPQRFGQAAHLAVGLTIVSSYLGGRVVFRHRVGVG